MLLLMLLVTNVATIIITTITMSTSRMSKECIDAVVAHDLAINSYVFTINQSTIMLLIIWISNVPNITTSAKK